MEPEEETLELFYPQSRGNSGSSLSSQSTVSRPESRTLEEALKNETDFMEYVLSLPSNSESKGSFSLKHSQSVRTVPTTTDTKQGFDQLDNLCLLMQQLGELRETNYRLQRKVQYLEDMKSLHNYHQQLQRSFSIKDSSKTKSKSQYTVRDTEESSQCSSSGIETKGIDTDDNIVDSLPDNVETVCPIQKSRSQASISPEARLKHQRSKSVGHEGFNDDEVEQVKSNVQKIHRFPKWLKMKGALGFERRPTTSNINSRQKRNMETKCTKGKLCPTDERGFCSSHSDSGYSQEAGSFDAITLQNGRRYIKNQKSRSASAKSSRRDASCESRTLGKRMSQQDCLDRVFDNSGCSMQDMEGFVAPNDDDEPYSGLGKPASKSRGPWSRMKTMIQTRKNSIKRRSKGRRSDSQNDKVDKSLLYVDNDGQGLLENGSSSEDPDFAGHSLQTTKSLSEIYPRGSSLNNNAALIVRRLSQNSGKEKCRRGTAAEEERVSIKEPEPNEPQNRYSKKKSGFYRKKPKDLNLSSEALALLSSECGKDLPNSNHESNTPCASPPVQRRSKWTKMKKVFANAGEGVKPFRPPLMRCKETGAQSVPVSPNHFQSSPTSSSTISFTYEDLETAGEQFEPLDDATVNEDFTLPPLSLSATAPVSNLMLELRRNISSDFNKKIQEWEKMKGANPTSGVTGKGGPLCKSESMKPNHLMGLMSVKNRRSERGEDNKCGKQKLNWLEKELEKIEKEKKRLSKEKAKYEEKAFKLQKLKEATLVTKRGEKNQKKEVLVRTSLGEFRFEGISDEFTKKLYKWETKMGLRAESSTIALLDSTLNNGLQHHSFLPGQVEMPTRGIKYQRGISRSETSILEVKQVAKVAKKAFFSSLPSLQKLEGIVRRPLFCKKRSS